MQITQMLEFLLGWPLIIYTLFLSFICTIITRAVQVRTFFKMWKMAVASEEGKSNTDMTPLQAFINTLSSNIGNSSLAGMATAVFLGGPGAAIWVVIAGILLMSVRFAEVYLSLSDESIHNKHSYFEGPMGYLHKLPYGEAFATSYAFFGLCYGLLVGNAVQTNSISQSIQTTYPISPYFIALLLGGFVAYVMIGGASRIVKVNEAIVPVKVVTFFAASITLIIYHRAFAVQALSLMVHHAFSFKAVGGGVAGFTMMSAMRFGISRVIFATEAGLGTAGILFGSTKSKNPIKDATLSMLSTFISTLVCFLVAFCIVLSGVWDIGLTSTPLTIAAFGTVFGAASGWLVSFLSLTFGAGVLVTYSYVTFTTWRYLTGNRYQEFFILLFCLVAFWGAIADVGSVWLAGEVANAGMFFINLIGITYLLPLVISAVKTKKN